MAENWTIATMAFSIMINFIIIAFFAVTGMGRQVFGRFKRRLLYSRGKYVNALFLNKSGVMKEYFIKPEKDGKFRVNKKPYVRDARTSVLFDKIPSQVFVEDTPTPLNLYNMSYDSLSCGELDTVIMANTQFDLGEWLKKIFPFIIIGIFILVAVLAANTYFGVSIYQMLRDAAPTAATAANSIAGG